MVNFVAHLIVFLSHGIFCLLTVLETWQIKFERTDELNSKPTSLFAAYNLNSLNGKLNGPSREENTPWFKWTQIDQSSRQRVNPKFTHICPYGSLWVFEARRPSHVCLPQLLIPFLGEKKETSACILVYSPHPLATGGKWIPRFQFVFYKSVGRLQKTFSCTRFVTIFAWILPD